MYCPQCGSLHDETSSYELNGKLPSERKNLYLNNNEIIQGNVIVCHNWKHKKFFVAELPVIPLAEILSNIKDGKQIQAIKLFRDETRLGLKDAKDCVDMIRDRMFPDRNYK